MALKDHSTNTRDLFMFKPEILQIDPSYNIEGRNSFDPTHDEKDNELLEDIREHGIYTPLVVRLADNKVFVVQGHRRLSAVKVLIGAGVPIETIPCMSEPRGTNDADRKMDLVVSNNSTGNGTKPINEFQRAAIFVEMINVFGWTDAQIAKKARCSEQTVRNQIAIHALPSAVKQMVAADQISASEAVKVVRSEGESAKEVLSEALEIAKAEGKTKVTAKSLAKVDTKAAAKKAEKVAKKEKAPDATPPVPAASDREEDVKAAILAVLGAMIPTLEQYESDAKINPRYRRSIEKARLEVANAFDVIDQN